MTFKPELESLNSLEYLFLRELSEPRDNSLRLLVQEAVVNPAGSSRSFYKTIHGGSPIESTPGCRTFELTWDHYTAYLVTEEIVGSCGQDADEIYTGKLFRLYTKSHFLEHLARDTGGHPESILHFKLICQNHLIDVAAYALPEFRQTERTGQDPEQKPLTVGRCAEQVDHFQFGHSSQLTTVLSNRVEMSGRPLYLAKEDFTAWAEKGLFPDIYER